MPEGNRNQTTGTANATPVNVDTKHLGHAVSVKVQLSINYSKANPPGWPTAPSMTGAAAASLDYPRTHLSGAILTLLKPEADALVAAGAATYV